MLYKSADRRNIYEQRRLCAKPIDVSNITSELKFLIPALADASFVKCQIFCVTKRMTDITGNISVYVIVHWNGFIIPAAFIRTELSRVSAMLDGGLVPNIEKLTGDSSKMEKQRVMESFRDR